MGQSEGHRWLVRNLMTLWSLEYPSGAFIRADGEYGLVCPVIAGFRPDLYHETPAALVLLGEAKTAKDVERQHSLEQLCAFYAYLKKVGRGEMHLSVDWESVDAMYFMARTCRRRAGAPEVPFVVYGWVRERNEPVQILRG